MKKLCFLLFLPPFFLIGCSFEDDAGDPLPDLQQEAPTPPEKEDDNDDDPSDIEAPTIPQHLVISNLSFESMSLSWEASSDNVKVEEYEVFMNGESLKKLSTTSLDLENLVPGETYALGVLARDGSGNASDLSEFLEETTLKDTVPPSIPQDFKSSKVTTTSITLSWAASTDNAGIQDYDLFMDNTSLTTTTATEFVLEQLEQGTTYTFQIKARDIYGNVSELSAPLEVTTESEPTEPVSTAVLFSEYIEGSGFNKALEIVNLSDAEIDLTNYSLKKITNENETWSDEKKLEGILSHGEVFVISHSRASEEILEQADMTLGGGIMSFNGNDIIGLFLDGELIDIIGEPGGEDFAKDVTLRRKTAVTSSNPVYESNEWEVLEIDNSEGLGSY